MSILTVTQTLVCALVLALPLIAADDAQLLDQFRKTKPDVSEVHVIAEQPLLIATTGKRAGIQGTGKTPSSWARGELLGVFARRGDQIVPISIQPNEEFPTAVWIERQSPDSITFGLADPDYGILSDNLKIFFDPKTCFPRRIVRFAPVRVRRIRVAAGVVTLLGSDGKQDFTAHERNGLWRVTTAPAAAPVTTPPVESVAEVAPMPVSTIGQFQQARPAKAKLFPNAAPNEIEEKIGPYERIGKQIWVGKTFYDAEGSVGVGDIGYFDETTHDWAFLHIPEMADWSTSALLVEPDAIWVGLIRNGEGAADSGGLLRYDRSSHRATRIPFADVVDKIIRVRNRIYCGTSSGFAIVEQDHARRFEFVPQLDGSYVITPVT